MWCVWMGRDSEEMLKGGGWSVGQLRVKRGKEKGREEKRREEKRREEKRREEKRREEKRREEKRREESEVSRNAAHSLLERMEMTGKMCCPRIYVVSGLWSIFALCLIRIRDN